MNFAQVPKQDLRLILQGSLLKIGNSVYFCEEVGDENLSLLHIMSGEREIAPIESVDIMQPYLGPLGYMNTEDGAGYVARQPRRQYRAGIHPNNIIVQYPDSDISERLLDRISTRIHRGITTPLFLQTNEDQYMSVEEAAQKAVERESMFAINRLFAVDYLGAFFFKTKRVGSFEEGAVKFFDDYKILEGIYQC